jgi:hypothetical protein
MKRSEYAPSVIPGHNDHTCWRCGRNGSQDPLNRHEIYHSDMGGNLRDRCKQYGLWVHLCHHRCHQGPTGVHNDPEFDLLLKQTAQKCAMETYGWSTEEFVSLFGKNYL